MFGIVGRMDSMNRAAKQAQDKSILDLTTIANEIMKRGDEITLEDIMNIHRAMALDGGKRERERSRRAKKGEITGFFLQALRMESTDRLSQSARICTSRSIASSCHSKKYVRKMRR